MILNHKYVLFLCALIFLGGATLAFYHVGIENHVFTLPSVCQAHSLIGSIEQLKAQLSQRVVIPCDQVPWEFLGVSLAGYNGLLSTGLFLICMGLYFRIRHNDRA